jgi:3alpha(or 20beta)-hydroxysteroid dehydrogenase
MARLDGKVALITGAASGMGASHARGFAAEGAKVVLADVLDDEGAEVAAELGDAGRFVHLDVSDNEGWAAAVQIAVEQYGGLDVLVNNAGIAGYAPFEEHSLDTWNRVIEVNLTGVFYGIKAAIEPLKRRGGGSIINVSSVAGLRGYPDRPSYVSSKFGVRGLTKSVALDLGQYGIRVNSVHPGWIETGLSAHAPEKWLDTLALGRTGDPSEATALMVYLASDESSYSTGAEFVIDGGQCAGSAPRDPGTTIERNN